MRMRTQDMPVALQLPVATFRTTDSDEFTVAFVTLKAGADATPLLQGLAGDLCQCPHWGYMLTGVIHVRYSDGKEEVCRAGDIFHWPAGHTVWEDEDTSFIEFSPKRQLREVYDHIGKIVSAMA